MVARGRAADTAADEQQPPAPGPTLPLLVKLAAATTCCLGLANCVSTTSGTSLATTTFDPQLGVYASPRVVEGDAPIAPSVSRRGVAMVGKPYVVAGKRYVPREPKRYTVIGAASWYGNDFHGRRTANGEVFDMHDITAANPVLPLPCYARVTNLSNGDSIVVRVNDRGPYHAGRVIDISSRAADLIEMKRSGIGHVKVEYLGHAEPDADDTRMLAASLRTDGSLASLPGMGGDTMLADAADSNPPVPPVDVPDAATQPAPVAVASAAPDAATTDGDSGLLTGTSVKTVSSSAIASAAPDIADGPQAVAYTQAPIPQPVERPIDLDTVPNADTPVPAAVDATPLHPPAHVPLPPIRNAAARPTHRGAPKPPLHEAMGEVLIQPDRPMLLTALAASSTAGRSPAPFAP